MTEKYSVAMMLRSTKSADKYAYGFVQVYRNMDTREIRAIKGINRFYESLTRAEMLQEYNKRKLHSKKIDKVITNIEDFHKDFIYYPTLGIKDEHEICRRYIDNVSVIDYPKARLQGAKDKNGIWKDDSKEVVKYRFADETCKMVTYGLAFAIDSVVKDQFKEMMIALSE